MLKRFRSPGAEFRGAPFWSWNAKLDPDELRRQVRVMRDMGMGGFFMHSRVDENGAPGDYRRLKKGELARGGGQTIMSWYPWGSSRRRN